MNNTDKKSMSSVLSIRDLLAEVVRYIWLVVICMVLFGILLGGYKYGKDLTASKEAVEEAELSDTFTTEEISQILNYATLKNRYENYAEYVYSTPVMEINAQQADTVSIQYMVSTSDQNAKRDIASSYIGYITNGNLAQDVADAYEELEVSEVQSLIQHVSREELYIPTERTGVVELKIWGRTEEESQALAKIVKECIFSYSNTLKENSLSHELEIVDESYFKIYDSDLYNIQVVYTDNIKLELDAISNVESELSAAQLEAAERLVASDEVEEEAEDEKDATNTKVSISKKYVVLGMALGMVLAAGIIVAWYILTATIKFSEEIRMVYGIRYFGQISTKKKNACERLADKIFYSSKVASVEDQKELLCSKILMTCETEGVKEFVLTGSWGKNQDYVTELQKKLKENGISVKIVGDIVKNPEALKELKGEQNIIFVEMIKKSHYENIHQEIVLCDEQNINVLGYIIFE